MKKVIYLDLENTLSSELFKTTEEKQEKGLYYKHSSPIEFLKVKLLKELCDKNKAQIVLLSDTPDFESLDSFIEKTGLPVDGILEYTGNSKLKDSAISKYNEEHNITGFAILDSKTKPYVKNKSQLVTVTYELGLMQSNLDKVNKLLNPIPKRKLKP